MFCIRWSIGEKLLEGVLIDRNGLAFRQLSVAEAIEVGLLAFIAPSIWSRAADLQIHHDVLAIRQHHFRLDIMVPPVSCLIRSITLAKAA